MNYFDNLWLIEAEMSKYSLIPVCLTWQFAASLFSLLCSTDGCWLINSTLTVEECFYDDDSWGRTSDLVTCWSRVSELRSEVKQTNFPLRKKNSEKLTVQWFIICDDGLPLTSEAVVILTQEVPLTFHTARRHNEHRASCWFGTLLASGK